MTGQSLFAAGLMLVISCVIGAIIIFAIAVPNDIIESSFADYGMFDVSPDWGSAADHTIPARGIYLVGYGLPLFGIINFFYVAVKRQRYDTQETREEFE